MDLSDAISQCRCDWCAEMKRLKRWWQRFRSMGAIFAALPAGHALAAVIFGFAMPQLILVALFEGAALGCALGAWLLKRRGVRLLMERARDAQQLRMMEAALTVLQRGTAGVFKLTADGAIEVTGEAAPEPKT